MKGLEKFCWWFGVVEDRIDPLKLGRYRVRILGYHTEDKNLIPTEELPWAYPLMPINVAQESSPVGLTEGTWVLGFFRDQDNAQQPIILGVTNYGYVEERPELPEFVEEEELTEEEVVTIQVITEAGTEEESIENVEVVLTEEGETINDVDGFKDSGLGFTSRPQKLTFTFMKDERLTDDDPKTAWPLRFSVATETVEDKDKFYPRQTALIPPVTADDVASASEEEYKFLGTTNVHRLVRGEHLDTTQFHRIRRNVNALDEFDMEILELPPAWQSAIITKTFLDDPDDSDLADPPSVDDPDPMINKVEPVPGGYSVYPYNKAEESESGHLFEIDDTPGNERLVKMHRSGTLEEINPDGSSVTRIMGDKYEIVLKDNNVHIYGDCNLFLEGNVKTEIGKDNDLNIKGNHTQVVSGQTKEQYQQKREIENKSGYDFKTRGKTREEYSGSYSKKISGANEFIDSVSVSTGSEDGMGTIKETKTASGEGAVISSVSSAGDDGFISESKTAGTITSTRNVGEKGTAIDTVTGSSTLSTTETTSIISAKEMLLSSTEESISLTANGDVNLTSTDGTVKLTAEEAVALMGTGDQAVLASKLKPILTTIITFLQTHTHTVPSHTYTIPAHSHSLGSHNHDVSIGSHSHSYTWGADAGSGNTGPTTPSGSVGSKSLGNSGSTPQVTETIINEAVLKADLSDSLNGIRADNEGNVYFSEKVKLD